MLKKILIATNDSNEVAAVAKIIEKHGIAVGINVSGAEARKTVERDADISLILIDADSGTGPEGPETARKILETRDLPIVFLIRQDEPKNFEFLEKITGYGCILKDSSEPMLISTLWNAYRLYEGHQKLKESEERFRIISELSSDFAYCHRLKGDGSLNPVWHIGSFNDITGYTPEELYRLGGWPQLIHPDDIPGAAHYVEELISGRESTFTARIQTKNGGVRWIRDRGKPWIDKKTGDVLGTYGFAIDITHEKEAEQKVKENELLYHSLMENNIDAVYLLDESGKVLSANQVAFDMIGYSRDELLEMTIDDIDPNYPSQNFIDFWKQQPEGASILFESFHRHKNGRLIPVEINGIFFLLNGKKHLFGVARDLTERRLAERRLQRIMEKSPVGFLYVDKDFRIIYENPRMREMFERPEDGESSWMMGNDLREIIPLSQIHDFDISSELKLGRRINFEVNLPGNDTVSHSLSIHGVPMFHMHQFDGAVLMVEDITAKKEAEEREDFHRMQFRSLFENTPTAIVMMDLQNHVLEANDAFEEIFGFSSDEIKGKKLEDMICPRRFLNTDSKELDLESLTGVRGWSIIRKRKDGREIDVRVSAGPVRQHGKHIGRFAIFEDITEEKQREKELHSLLHEKDYLMKELNHRVKNNLHLVSSLIKLKDSEVGESADLSDLSHRIDAVRLVHEMLYKTDSITRIVIREYIQNILESVFGTGTRGDIEIVIDCGDYVLDAKITLSIGLIINEIATNAIKHGFRSGEAARFRVSLQKDPQSSGYILTLSNTGRPFPESIDFDNPDTFGLRLISSLVEQLEGTLHLKRKPVPVFTIRFPAD